MNVNLKISTKDKKIYTQENSIFQNKLVAHASEQGHLAVSAQGAVARIENLPSCAKKHFLPASNTAIYPG